jgi:ABC-2 type transport system permease protein
MYFGRRLRTLRAVAVVTYKEWAAYRTHSLVSLFVGPVFFLSQILIWRALYTGRELIGGLTLNEMLSYLGLVTLIGYLTMDFADWNLQMLIRTGKFTTFMLRPVHHRFFALSQKIGHRFLGLLYEFIPVFLIIRFILGIKFHLAYPFWAAVSIALGFLMTFYINYCIGITGFWLTRTTGARAIFQLVSRVFSGVFLPLTFFPAALQQVLLFMPFQFTTYLPVSVCIGKYSLGGVTLPIPAAVGMQAAAVLIVALLSELFYRRGIKKFSGVGT